MKSYLYKAKIFDSFMDSIHSYSGKVINEIFIPEVKICFNDKGYIFRSDSARSEDVKEYEIADDFALALEDFVCTKESINNEISNFFQWRIK